MRKSWKSQDTLNHELLSSIRIAHNREADPPRDYPGQIRMSNVPADSAVAEYVSRQDGFCKRKDFSPAKGTFDFDNTMPFFEEDMFYKVVMPVPPTAEEEKKR